MIRMKDWYYNKAFSIEEKRALETCYNTKILKETEKALNVRFDTDFGSITTWIPKSVLLEIEVYNKGDKVKTYYGVGEVIETDEEIVKVLVNEEVKMFTITKVERV